jgi:hypothetical protein
VNILKLNYKKLLISGISAAFIGILIVASFQFIDDHRWFWKAAPFICLLVLAFTAGGSLLVGHSLSRSQDRRLWLVGIGAFIGLAWIGTGILASGLAALGMYYLPSEGVHVGWDSYTSSFLFSGSQIRFLQFAVATGLIGGFSIGFGLAKKRFPAIA